MLTHPPKPASYESLCSLIILCRGYQRCYLLVSYFYSQAIPQKYWSFGVPIKKNDWTDIWHFCHFGVESVCQNASRWVSLNSDSLVFHTHLKMHISSHVHLSSATNYIPKLWVGHFTFNLFQVALISAHRDFVWLREWGKKDTDNKVVSITSLLTERGYTMFISQAWVSMELLELNYLLGLCGGKYDKHIWAAGQSEIGQIRYQRQASVMLS